MFLRFCLDFLRCGFLDSGFCDLGLSCFSSKISTRQREPCFVRQTWGSKLLLDLGSQLLLKRVYIEVGKQYKAHGGGLLRFE